MVEFRILPFSAVKDDIVNFVIKHRESNTEEMVKWRYRQLFEQDNINALAFDKDNLIGLESYFVRKIMIAGAEYYLGDSGHNQVEKDYEGKGIFSQLLSLAGKEAERCSIRYCFCIPTERIMRIFLKQNWLHIGNMAEYSKRISIYSKLFSFIPVRVICEFCDKLYTGVSIYLSWYPFVKTDNFRFSHVSELDERYYVLCREINKSVPVMRVRDKGFLTWRFCEKPLERSEHKLFELTSGSELRGYIVLLFEEEFNTVTILDFLAKYDDLAVLLKMTISYLKSLKEKRSSKISVGLSEKHAFGKVFRLFRFRRLKKTLPVIVKVCEDSGLPHSLAFLASRIENWHLTYADKDTI